MSQASSLSRNFSNSLCALKLKHTFSLQQWCQSQLLVGNLKSIVQVLKWIDFGQFVVFNDVRPATYIQHYIMNNTKNKNSANKQTSQFQYIFHMCTICSLHHCCFQFELMIQNLYLASLSHNTLGYKSETEVRQTGLWQCHPIAKSGKINLCLCMSALKASPSRQLVVKFLTLTFG